MIYPIQPIVRTPGLDVEIEEQGADELDQLFFFHSPC